MDRDLDFFFLLLVVYIVYLHVALFTLFQVQLLVTRKVTLVVAFGFLPQNFGWYGLTLSFYSGGSKGSSRDARSPGGVQILSISCSFGKFWQNCMLAPPGELPPPHLGEILYPPLFYEYRLSEWWDTQILPAVIDFELFALTDGSDAKTFTRARATR